jgi:hypothetical protein
MLDVELIKFVKITIERRDPRGSDMSVKFGISEHTREKFMKGLFDFLELAQSLEAIITVDEVLDAETHQPSELQITLKGDQQRLGHELQVRSSGVLADASVWVV